MVETLTALMPMRGIKSITFSRRVTKILTKGGQANFMSLLRRTITSKPIYRGNIKDMLRNLEDFLCAFCPFYAKDGNSVFQPRERWFILPGSVRKNLLELRSVLAKETCWASFRVFRDRILYEVNTRMNNIERARANVGNGPYPETMLQLFNSFCDIEHDIKSFTPRRQTARQKAQAKKHPNNHKEWRQAVYELSTVTCRGTYRGRPSASRVQQIEQDKAEILVGKIDVVIARIKEKYDIVKADIAACDLVSDVETPESRKYVSDRKKRVDEGRSALDRTLDSLIGDDFDWKDGA